MVSGLVPQMPRRCASPSMVSESSSAASSATSVTFESDVDFQDYYSCVGTAPPVAEGLKAGMRVVTKIVVASNTKREYPAGTAARVWDIQEDGVVVLALDETPVVYALVVAGEFEVLPEPFLKVGAKVCGLSALVRGTGATIPPTAVGEILNVDAKTGEYEVAYWSYRRKSLVHAKLVRPAPSRLRLAASFVASVVRPTGKAALDVPQDMPVQIAAEATAALANLKKTPSRSSIRGSATA
eukprot:TRINITY_DN29777_c0_g1_i1.p1 TRINITY_DN29777_c0_g1~~TRINITY_DN29777_c0_g1_i1.p1  ORF type:complete len:240 (+),score=85.27 TRINITY_DN29777_c0_g1_i1:49-768(+)